MTDKYLVQRLYKMAKPGTINYQETEIIREAAGRLLGLSGMVEALKDKVDELDERVSIMMEGCNITEEKYQQMVIERMERI